MKAAENKLFPVVDQLKMAENLAFLLMRKAGFSPSNSPATGVTDDAAKRKRACADWGNRRSSDCGQLPAHVASR